MVSLICSVTCIAVILLVILGTLCDIALRYRILRTIEKDERNENASTEMKILNARKNVNEKITIAKLWSVKEHNTSLGIRRMFCYCQQLRFSDTGVYRRRKQFEQRAKTSVGGSVILQSAGESVENI